MADEEIPKDLRADLDRLLAALAADVQLPVPPMRVVANALHANLQEGLLVIPKQYVAHWNRFGVVPTALVRDVAYAMKRRQLATHPSVSPASAEADAMAYAERFLRVATEPDDEDA